MGNALPKLGEDFEFWGFWWLPDNPHTQLPGCFASQKGWTSLTLLGSFPGIDVNQRDLCVSVILGVAETKLFTLCNAIQGVPGFKSPGTIEQRFSRAYCIVGNHFESHSSLSFDRVSIVNPMLSHFSGIPGASQSIDAAEERVGYEYSPDEKAYKFGKEGKSLIQFSTGVRTEMAEGEYCGFSVFPRASLKLEKSEPLNWCLSYIHSLREMLSLLTGFDLVPTATSLGLKSTEHPGRYHDLEIIPPYSQAYAPKVNHPDEILLTLESIGAAVEDFFRGWSELRNGIFDPLSIYLGLQGRHSMPDHLRIISLCSALESFHRDNVGGRYMSDDAFRSVSKAIIESIPDELDSSHRNALKTRIKYGNLFSLRKRMKDLLRDLDQKTLDSLQIDVETYTDKVVTARDHFTHLHGSGDEALSGGAQLANLVGSLDVVLKITFLKYLGIPETVVTQRVVRNRHVFWPEWKELG